MTVAPNTGVLKNFAIKYINGRLTMKKRGVKAKNRPLNVDE
jgi:hypothetical protein